MRDKHLAVEAAIASCAFLQEKINVECIPIKDYLDIFSSMGYEPLKSLSLEGFNFKCTFYNKETDSTIKLKGSFYDGECWLGPSETKSKDGKG